MSVTLMITLMATISTQHLSWRSPQQSNYQLLDAGVQQEKMHAVENQTPRWIFLRWKVLHRTG